MKVHLVEDRWVQQFIAMQGTRVLTQFISYISRKGKQRFVLSPCRFFLCTLNDPQGPKPTMR
jgi:hypothetical protein